MKNTGFLTTKGGLIRDILYPKDIKFAFHRDGLTFFGIMGVVALITSLSTIPTQMEVGVPDDILVMHSLDTFTIAVPPALPAAVSCGVVFAV